MRPGPRFLLIVLWLFLPAVSRAQYIYIDTNGDGLPGTGDILQASGETTLDIWLRTDRNRDGSPASCSDPGTQLTMSAYEFILKARYGTMSWGALTNRVPELSVGMGVSSSYTEYHAGYYGGQYLPAGTYRLATLQVSVASGTPEIEFAPATDLPGGFYTGFGSECPGPSFDYYQKLGSEWFDADGVGYSGAVNHPPELRPIEDVILPEAATLDVPISATDTDGEALAFSMLSGPAYMTVATLDAGSGSASGVIHLAPGFSDSGPATGIVAVTDGAAADTASFSITVENTNRPPFLDQPFDMEVAAGTETYQGVRGTDPDGQLVQLTKVAGPNFMSVIWVFRGFGMIHLQPDRDVFGRFVGTVAASDGALTDEKSFNIHAHGAVTLDQPADMTVAVNGTAEQTLRASDPEGVPLSFSRTLGPAFVNVTTTDPGSGAATGRFHVSPGEFDAGLYLVRVAATDGLSVDERSLHVRVVDPTGPGAAARQLFAGAFLSSEVSLHPGSLAPADFNEDGVPDLAVLASDYSDFSWDKVVILLGNGDGTLARYVDFYIGNARVAAADLNRDGHADLLGLGNGLAILLGNGDGTFGPLADYPTASNCHDLAVGDWNGDGWPDLAVVSNSTDRVYTYLNSGDGTFAGRQEYPAGRYPERIVAGDVTGDGYPDLLVACIDDGSVDLYRGRPGGSFEARVPIPNAASLGSIALADVDRDGFLDILGIGTSIPGVAFVRGAGDGSFAERTVWPVGTQPSSFDAGDVDQDGELDLVVTAGGYDGNTISYLRGMGGGAFAPETVYEAGPAPGYIRLADLNLDGILDAVSSSSGSTTVTTLLGKAGGGFESDLDSPGVHQASGATALDWTGDGLVDLALADIRQGAIALFAARADGTFEPGPTFMPGGSVDGLIAGDWNGDGIPDLAVLDRAASKVSTLRGLGGGAYAPTGAWTVAYMAVGMIVADFDRDGDADLAVGDRYFNSVTLLRGRGDGTFSVETAVGGISGPSALAAGDFDEDGALDLATARYYGCSVYRGHGDGTFDPSGTFVGLGAEPQDLVAVDLDGDGHLDLGFTLADDGKVAVAWGDGHGAFTEPGRYDVARGPRYLATADWNGDGRSDLAAACGGANVVSLLLGGAGRDSFGSRIDVGCGPGVTAVLPADWNRDGHLDIATVDAGSGTLSTLLNRGAYRRNRPPVASAGGPYSGVAGAPIELSGASSADPDGDALSYLWFLGDGATAAGVVVAHAYGQGGVYSVVLEVTDGSAAAQDTTSASILSSLPARVFRRAGTGVFPTMGGPPRVYFQLEPVEGAFTIEAIDPSTLRLVSEGTGSVSEIPAVTGKTTLSSDTDRNGVSELGVPFARADLERLFSSIEGRKTVPLLMRGRLLTGAVLEGPCALTVVGQSDEPLALAYPNPFNPEGRIGFTVPAPGPVTVRVFDPAGRLVMTLLESERLPAGYHEIPVHAGGGSGRSLGSGVYLYRVETARGATSGRFTVLK